MDYCREHLKQWQMVVLNEQIEAAKAKVRAKTAWRIEGTLREFPKFEPVNLWFDYPTHRLDHIGSLKDLQLEAQEPPWKKGAKNNKKNAVTRKAERKKALEIALEGSNFGDEPTVNDIADYLGVSTRTARDRINEHGDYVIEDGIVRKREEGKTES